jgi:alpha-L-fucosidase
MIRLLLLPVLLVGSFSVAQETPYLSADPTDLAWFREARFGMFVHWGPVSLKGTEIGWSRGGERRGTGGTGTIPVEVYDNLYKSFNPVKFDAKEWVALAKDAGMKYLVFTTKHHDGFCMFDSALTDYKITNSPFKRDVVKELADACHEVGIRLGFYYSPPDWHHPDYRTDRHAEYVKYLHGQIEELCENYGRLDIMWFDGLGGSSEDWDSPELFKLVRTRQPHILINNRAGLPGDFGTPEQRVGGFQNDRPWESCITIGQQWAYKPDDEIKSTKECIGTLVRCVGGDGNLLLNVGPMPTGEIEPAQAARLREMGVWLRRYGESVYGTRGGPFKPGKWGASTHKSNVIYLHVLDWDGLSLDLSRLGPKVVSAKLLTGGEAELEESESGLSIRVAEQYRDATDTIIRLELDGPASEIAPRTLTPSGSLAMGKPVKASNVYRSMHEYAPDRAVDDDDGTRWATDLGTQQAWLEVDLGKRVRIDRVKIREAYGERVRKFELQYATDGEWRKVFEGQGIGEEYVKRFEPVTATRVRLVILEADAPTIWEFQLFGPDE